MAHEWVKEFPGAVIVCDTAGIIVEMNESACRQLAKWGGETLLGSNLLDCHPEPSKRQLAAMLNNQTPNSYTIEKNGIIKMVHQSPWYKDGTYAGFVEIFFEIPGELQHKLRK